MAKRKLQSDGLPDVVFERGLPASIDAERSILGAVLLDNAAYYETDRVTYDDFALDSHRRVFAAMAALIADGRIVDVVTLSEHLDSKHEIDAIGGRAYLFSLTEGLPRRISIGEYVRIVKDKSQLRRTINVCANAITLAADQGTTADELLTDTDIRLLEIAADNLSAPETMAVSASNEFLLLREERANRNTVRAVASGIETLDDGLGGGWAEGELAICAGKPGQGKSSLLNQTLIQCGRNGIPAHCFQLEMTKSQVLRRMWSAMTGIKIGLLQHPQFLNDQQVELIDAAQRETAQFPLVLDVDSRLTKQQIIARARISQRRNGTRFVGLDYLQRIRFESKPDFRHIEVGDTAKLLAIFAKEEHVAVLAVSSLTDKGGRAEDVPPVLADLRQSGDIQYEASTVVFVHREHEEAMRRLKRHGLLIVGKQRNGDTGDVPVFYNHFSTFETEAGQAEEESDQLRMAL
jgi:replicative DNA helicase